MEEVKLQTPPVLTTPPGSASDAGRSRSPVSMAPRVLTLFGLKDASFSEDSARTLFASYASSNPHYLSRQDLRSLLSDLNEALGYPPFVPDQSLDSVFKELQLDVTASDKFVEGSSEVAEPVISWAEFKSFFVFLVAAPLRQLHEFAIEPLRASGVDFSDSELFKTKAVLVSNLPEKLTLDEFRKAFVEIITPKHTFVAAFLCPGEDLRSTDAVVFFSDTEAASVVLAADGCRLLERQIEIVPYKRQRFPTPVSASAGGASTPASGIARALAAVVVSAKEVTKDIDSSLKISSSLKRFDTEHKITENLDKGAKSVAQKTTEIDESIGFTTGVSTFAKKVDESLKVTEGISAAKQAIIANPTIRSGISSIGSFFSSVTASLSEFGTQTKTAIEEEESLRNRIRAMEVDPAASAAAAPGSAASAAAAPVPPSFSAPPAAAASDSKPAAEAENVVVDDEGGIDIGADGEVFHYPST